MKKRIGIVGWNTGENSFGITKPYAEYFSKFGQVVILTPNENADLSLDLLVLPGGLDLAPQSSKMLPSFYTSNTDVMKQYFYDVTLKDYIKNNIPIFGICLGFQQLCSYFGANLIQNKKYIRSGDDRSRLVDVLNISPKYLDYVNNAFLEDEDQDVRKKDIYEILKYYGVDKKKINSEALQNLFPANSIHHQGVNVKIDNDNIPYVPNTNITVVAYHSFYKNLEVAYFSENIAGAQYHPEETNCPVANRIILDLLKI